LIRAWVRTHPQTRLRSQSHQRQLRRISPKRLNAGLAKAVEI
jgi:hypothetical protein